MKNLFNEAPFSIIFVLLLLSFLIFIGCTSARPRNAEGVENETLFRHLTKDIVHSNKDKVNVELINRNTDFKMAMNFSFP